jgi:ABC-type ATPase with predicted acetyltransferase domain
MLLNVAYSIPPKRNSVRASLVMDHFGISVDIAERILARDLEIPLEAGDVVLFTGGSGSGKSSLLRALVAQLETELAGSPGSPALWNLQNLDLGQQTLIDALPLEFNESLQLLASCGLGEAQLMLRTPQELSDGQRYRFALALAIAHRPRWIVADEFAALLDRTTAQVIAHNIRRLADRTGIGFLLATAQNDIHLDLEADIHVTCELDGQIDVHMTREDTATIPFTNTPTSPPLKKKEPPSASATTSGSALPPSATGRTSLGGIIAATTSD